MIRCRDYVLTIVAAASVLAAPNLSQAGEVEEVTKEYCKCVEPAFAEIEKMKGMMARGDMAAMNQAVAKMQANQSKMTACMKELEGRHGHRKEDKVFAEKVHAEIKKQCPPPKFGPPQGLSPQG